MLRANGCQIRGRLQVLDLDLDLLCKLGTAGFVAMHLNHGLRYFQLVISGSFLEMEPLGIQKLHSGLSVHVCHSDQYAMF
jgi:hypothetical protein